VLVLFAFLFLKFSLLMEALNSKDKEYHFERETFDEQRAMVGTDGTKWVDWSGVSTMINYIVSVIALWPRFFANLIIATPHYFSPKDMLVSNSNK